eukprot:1158512-Pelagomonas_calceolata.AAC.5
MAALSQTPKFICLHLLGHHTCFHKGRASILRKRQCSSPLLPLYAAKQQQLIGGYAGFVLN